MLVITLLYISLMGYGSGLTCLALTYSTLFIVLMVIHILVAAVASFNTNLQLYPRASLDLSSLHWYSTGTLLYCSSTCSKLPDCLLGHCYGKSLLLFTLVLFMVK